MVGVVLVTIVTIIHHITVTIFTKTITLLIHIGVGDTITMDPIIQVITMDIIMDTIVDIGIIIMETTITETETIMVTVQQDRLCLLTDRKIVMQEHQQGKIIVQTTQDTDPVVLLLVEHRQQQLDQQQTAELRV